MPSNSYYRDQADLYFRMAGACSDPERAARYATRGRMYLNLPAQPTEKQPDLNTLLIAFNNRQLVGK